MHWYGNKKVVLLSNHTEIYRFQLLSFEKTCLFVVMYVFVSCFSCSQRFSIFFSCEL